MGGRTTGVRTKAITTLYAVTLRVRYARLVFIPSSRKGKFQAASAKALLQLSASFQDDHPPVKDAARSNTSARSVNPAAPDRSTGVVSLPDEHQGPLQGLSKSRSPRVLRPRALQSERVERVSNGSPGQPLAIFTAGIPGAGKTHTLNQVREAGQGGFEAAGAVTTDNDMKDEWTSEVDEHSGGAECGGWMLGSTCILFYLLVSFCLSFGRDCRMYGLP